MKNPFIHATESSIVIMIKWKLMEGVMVPHDIRDKIPSFRGGCLQSERGGENLGRLYREGSPKMQKADKLRLS